MDRREKILNQFLDVIYAHSHFMSKTNRRKFTRRCFGHVCDDNKKTFRAINNYLCVDSWKKYTPDNPDDYNIYDILNMTRSTGYINRTNQIVRKNFCNNVINLHLDNSYYLRMQKISEKLMRQRKHHIGTIIILATLLITILIPNHAINLTGITIGNFLSISYHFLMLQFFHLINVASIGRLIINALIDVPVIKYDFLK